MPRAPRASRPLAALLLALLALLVAAPVAAQGPPGEPQAGAAYELADLSGHAVPLGEGGLTARPAPGGHAAGDGVAWESLGQGVSFWVYALAAGPDGSLYVGGGFWEAGGQPANFVARWDGAAWHPLGAGVGGGAVYALAFGPDGSLYAGGYFTEAGGQPANRIARWDGEAWHALGEGVSCCVGVLALAFGPDGAVYAGGAFAEAGGLPARNVARWDGEAWHALGEGVNADVRSLAIGPDGSLYVGGYFTQAGEQPASRVARWDGGSWYPLGQGFNQAVFALTVGPDGSLYAGGGFTAPLGMSQNFVARWDGVSWGGLGDGLNHYVFDLAFGADGSLYAGGSFTQTRWGGWGAEQPLNRVARWDGVNWGALGTGVNALVWALAFEPSGGLFVGGEFQGAGGQPANRVAQATGLPVSSEPGAAVASSVSLSAPYPNPARGRVTLAFAVGEAGPVRLALYDVLGREVALALEAPLGPGPHEVTVPTSALTAGVYVVRLAAGGTVASRQITVVR